eukprot:1159938-Pelagomonas_calceolata.AAC.7
MPWSTSASQSARHTGPKEQLHAHMRECVQINPALSPMPWSTSASQSARHTGPKEQLHETYKEWPWYELKCA